jgi:hypothetical protein
MMSGMYQLAAVGLAFDSLQYILIFHGDKIKSADCQERGIGP